MLTVLDAIQKSTIFLENKGIESPRFNAEEILAKILNCKRLDLYLQFQKPLNNSEIDSYRELIRRRGEFEPLQYILGSVEFFGLEFYVNRNVLIPRQETEILLETIIKENDNEKELKILDVGTGSGNIPVVLAKYFSNSKIYSMDISESAIEVAKRNAVRNNVEDKITFFTGNVFDEPKNKIKFDIIVSNPPYVPISEFNTLQKEIVDYEPQIAVSDGNDGYKFYNRIIRVGRVLLKPGGKIYFEVGESQAQNVAKIFEVNNYKNINFVKDYLQIERVVSANI